MQVSWLARPDLGCSWRAGGVGGGLCGGLLRASVSFQSLRTAARLLTDSLLFVGLLAQRLCVGLSLIGLAPCLFGPRTDQRRLQRRCGIVDGGDGSQDGKLLGNVLRGDVHQATGGLALRVDRGFGWRWWGGRFFNHRLTLRSFLRLRLLQFCRLLGGLHAGNPGL